MLDPHAAIQVSREGYAASWETAVTDAPEGGAVAAMAVESATAPAVSVAIVRVFVILESLFGG